MNIASLAIFLGLTLIMTMTIDLYIKQNGWFGEYDVSFGWKDTVMAEEHAQIIRERAYQIWEQEGRPDGQSLVHWLKAEAEIGTGTLPVESAGREHGTRSTRRRRSSSVTT